MKAIQGREKRWARRGRLLSLFGCLLLQSNLHVLSSMPGKEKERDRRMGERPRKSVDRKKEKKKVGKAGTSGTVSQCLTLVSCPFFDARNDQREREREREGKRDKKL